MPIKILHIGLLLSGIRTYVSGIVKHSDPLEYQHVLITGSNATESVFHNANNQVVKTYFLPLKRSPSLMTDVINIHRVIKIIKTEKPHIIHAHSSIGGFIGRFAGLLTNTKLLYTPHAFSYLSTASNLKRLCYLHYEKLFRCITSGVLACSESEKTRALNDLRYAEKKVFVWSNCLEQPPKPPHRKLYDFRYICAIGRPSYQKNTLLMIKIIQYIKEHLQPDLKLVIAGAGFHSPLKRELVSTIRNLDLSDTVELIDWLPIEQVRHLLSQAECYLSTSRYEGLSYANLEALAYGIPIVASNVEGNRETVIDSWNGYLIKNNDIQAYAEAINKIISAKDRRLKMGLNSKQLFTENHDLKKNISLLDQIYSDVVSGKAPIQHNECV